MLAPGKVLRVDLSTGRAAEEPLEFGAVRDFLGCSGLSAKLLLDSGAWRPDPLSPEAPLVFAVGLLTGLPAPDTGRFTVCGKSPLTGIWGEANCGGTLPFALKRTGYWAVVVSGRASKPSTLVVSDEGAEIRDATHLWGLDSYATQEAVRREVGDKASVATIGVAGEKRSLLAAIMNDAGRAAARGGLGAVMGAKNLKAFAALGTRPVPIGDPAGFRDAAREAHAHVRDAMVTSMFRELGTAGYLDMGYMEGDAPVKYWTAGTFEGAHKLSGASMKETILTGKYHCIGCVIGCGREVEVPRLPGVRVDGPEYETVTAFGTLLMVDDLAKVAEAHHLCNVHGLDVISVGSTIGLALHLYEKAMLSIRDTGVALEWGNADLVLRLVEMTARREGFGALLADGAWRLARRVGHPEEAVVVKKLEVPMHDPRAFHGIAVQYATSPRGACHKQGEFYEIDIGLEEPEIGLRSAGRFEVAANLRPAIVDQDLKAVYNALSVCQFARVPTPLLARLVSAALGAPYSVADLLRTGSRLFQAKRLFNVRCGVRRNDDWLPQALLRPTPEGGAAGRVPHLTEAVLDEYYRLRGWDLSGVPVAETLAAHGIPSQGN
ncbi:MAG: aldehyde ferredoxin oxidoreductase family protein [Methanobacteriota archaeon]